MPWSPSGSTGSRSTLPDEREPSRGGRSGGHEWPATPPQQVGRGDSAHRVDQHQGRRPRPLVPADLVSGTADEVDESDQLQGALARAGHQDEPSAGRAQIAPSSSLHNGSLSSGSLLRSVQCRAPPVRACRRADSAGLRPADAPTRQGSGLQTRRLGRVQTCRRADSAGSG